MADIAKATLEDGGAGILIVFLASLLLSKLVDLWQSHRQLLSDRTERAQAGATGQTGHTQGHSDEMKVRHPRGTTGDQRPLQRHLEPLITKGRLPAPINTQGGQ